MRFPSMFCATEEFESALLRVDHATMLVEAWRDGGSSYRFVKKEICWRWALGVLVPSMTKSATKAYREIRKRRMARARGGRSQEVVYRVRVAGGLMARRVERDLAIAMGIYLRMV